MLKLVLCAVCVALVVVVPGIAQMKGNPENWCRPGAFAHDSTDFRVSLVKGRKGKRAYFYDDLAKNCPSAACRLKSYVISGDTVVTNRRRNGFVCAWFAPERGMPTVGWLRESDLNSRKMLSDVSTKIWTGEWKYAANSITFKSAGLDDLLEVRGNAFWHGLGDNIHIGELDGRFKHKDGLLEYADGSDEFDCRAMMHLVFENLLVVADNMNCGGANVTFSGVYHKLGRKFRKN